MKQSQQFIKIKQHDIMSWDSFFMDEWPPV